MTGASDRARIVFLGTPDFAVPSLVALSRAAEVALVICQPDRKAGRGRHLSPPPVKLAAVELGIEVLQPTVVKGKMFAERIAAYRPDFLVTAAFGRVLGPSLLALPKVDSLNVHASLLPKYRGAAPINHAILAGDAEAGVSIMRMELSLDAGPVFHSVRTPIGSAESAGELTMRLAAMGADAIVEVVTNYFCYKPKEQRHDLATWAPMLAKGDGAMDWSRSAQALHCHVRGMHPWPCATAHVEGVVIKVHKSTVVEGAGSGFAPGTVLSATPDGIDVACGNGVLRLLELQAPGRKRLACAQFLAGTHIASGVVFSSGT